MVLYSYWRSSCSWRVRIALNLKNIKYEYRAVNLLKAEQKGEEFGKLNPSKSLPALVLHGHTLTQSLAIMEYLEESFHEGQRLLPTEIPKRAQVKYQKLCFIVCQIQSGR